MWNKKQADQTISELKYLSVGVCPGCPECMDRYGYTDKHEFELAWQNGVEGETWFSWNRCDCCGGTAGDRMEAHYIHGFESGNEICEIEICFDCAMYITNGSVPTDWMCNCREESCDGECSNEQSHEGGVIQ